MPPASLVALVNKRGVPASRPCAPGARGGRGRANVALDDRVAELGVADAELHERFQRALEIAGLRAEAVGRKDTERHAAPR